MTEGRVFDTSRGPILVHGRLDDFRAGRPLLVMIRGAFPEIDQMVELGARFPQADFAWWDLPGMHSPAFAESSVAGFARAMDEAIDLAFPGRPVNVLGLSIGGTVALHLRNPFVRAVVACDPPLSTGGLWPIRDRFRLQGRAGFADWVWALFGIDDEGVVNRDYRAALEGLHRPVRVLLGADPLEPERPTPRTPSLVSREDRALYAAHKGVDVLVVEGAGHNIPRDGQPAILSSLRQLIPDGPRPA